MIRIGRRRDRKKTKEARGQLRRNIVHVVMMIYINCGPGTMFLSICCPGISARELCSINAIGSCFYFRYTTGSTRGPDQHFCVAWTKNDNLLDADDSYRSLAHVFCI